MTSFPEILDGRVKTLHPAIFGGILGIRDNPSHQSQMKEHSLQGIDLVVVNLYPFEDQAVAQDLGITESIEWIDIGGPSLIRASAKNHAFVTVVTDPRDYPAIMEELDRNKAEVSAETRQKLAVKAFHFTSYYDAVIANHYRRKLGLTDFPEYFPIALKLSSTLRYGETLIKKGPYIVRRHRPELV